MSTELVTVKQAAERLACSPKTIYKWVYNGTITERAVVRLGRMVRLRREEIERLATEGIDSRA